jgi:CTD kinase subunit alpha
LFLPLGRGFHANALYSRLQQIDGDWHEFESKQLRRENERKEKEARRAQEGSQTKEREQERKRVNEEAAENQRDAKRRQTEVPTQAKH